MNENERLIRLPELVSLIGVKKSTIWKWVKQGNLPQPIKLSSRVTVWRLSDVYAYIHSR